MYLFVVVFKVAPTQYRTYAEFPGLLVEEVLMCPFVHFSGRNGHLCRDTDVAKDSWIAFPHTRIP
jgi:hypothetical protein